MGTYSRPRLWRAPPFVCNSLIRMRIIFPLFLDIGGQSTIIDLSDNNQWPLFSHFSLFTGPLSTWADPEEQSNGDILITRITVGIGIIGTIAYWLILFFRVPLHKIIPGYFWHAMLTIEKPFVSYWYLIFAVILSGFVIWFVINHQSRVFVNLFLLIVCGWSLQLSFGLIEGGESKGSV